MALRRLPVRVRPVPLSRMPARTTSATMSPLSRKGERLGLETQATSPNVFTNLVETLFSSHHPRGYRLTSRTTVFQTDNEGASPSARSAQPQHPKRPRSRP